MHTSTQDARDKSKLAKELKDIETKYKQALSDLDTMNERLISQTKGEVSIIPTEKHHDLLADAFKKAERELFIVSPWMDARAVDSEIKSCIKRALAKGVIIRIAWGLGLKKAGYEAERSRIKAAPVIMALREMAGSDFTLLDIREEETHEKILICDDLFCAWGSFNWLSYRGQIDSNYKRESSFYSERPLDISLWKTRAKEMFP